MTTPTPKERVLLVGLNGPEQEEFQNWAQRNAVEVWFAGCALEALRVFDDVRPTHLVIDTLVEKATCDQLARVVAAACPGVQIVFVSNHNVEAAYFSNRTDLPSSRHCFRPIDPEDIVGRPGELEERVCGVPTRGEITFERLAELFLGIFDARQSGALYVGEGAMRKVIYFNQGRPSYATSHVLDENFGHFLLRQGVISRLEFDWARRIQMREGVQQGDALVKIGVLTPGRLDELLQEQVRMKILNAFALEGVPYRFDESPSVPCRRRYGFNVVDLLVSAVTERGAKAPDDSEPFDSVYRSLSTYLGPELAEHWGTTADREPAAGPELSALRWLLDRAGQLSPQRLQQ